MHIELNYGSETRSIKIESATVDILAPVEIRPLENFQDALNDALDYPLGTISLETMIRSTKPRTIAIAIPDETRPTPIGLILPTLISRIRKSLDSSATAKIIVMVGAGLHDPMSDQQIKMFIPQIVQDDCEICVHNASEMDAVDFGKTSRSTPVLIARKFAEADFKLVVGQIDPHQFVGFTGGAKGAAIGLGARETIEANHSLMFQENAVAGKLEGNPVREDLNEAGRMIGLGFAINVVLDSHKRVSGLYAGDPEKVLSEGARLCSSVYGVKLRQEYDIAIASCGGYPKDICLYQAQKGLNLASKCLKPGGRIVLLAKCQQGVGDDIYYNYVSRFNSPEQVLEDFKKLGFKMGAHKAYLFAKTQTEFEVAVASDLDPEKLSNCLLRAEEPNFIVQEWITSSHQRPRVAVIPYANTTFFLNSVS